MKTIVDTMSLADVGLLILEKVEDISKKMGSYIKNEKEPSYKRIIYKMGEEKIFFCLAIIITIILIFLTI